MLAGSTCLQIFSNSREEKVRVEHGPELLGSVQWLVGQQPQRITLVPPHQHSEEQHESFGWEIGQWIRVFALVP